MNNFDINSFLFFAMAVTLLMAGNAASGAMKARKEGKFSFEELKDGCLNYILWLATILCLVAATQIYGGDFTISEGDRTYTLLEAVELAKRVVYVVWAGKLIQNVYEYAGIKKQIDVEKIITEANLPEGEVVPEGGNG